MNIKYGTSPYFVDEDVPPELTIFFTEDGEARQLEYALNTSLVDSWNDSSRVRRGKTAANASGQESANDAGDAHSRVHRLMPRRIIGNEDEPGFEEAVKLLEMKLENSVG